MKKYKKKSSGLARFIITTLVLIAALMGGLVYGPVVLDYFVLHTPNYRAFGVLVPGGYSVTGIDVSRYQGKIDWEKVKKMRSGKYRVDFVFIKATEGLNYIDPQFNRNWRQCKKYRITFGAYHYFNPASDAVKQADFFASRYIPEKGNLPPVIDIEKTNNLRGDVIRKNLKACLVHLETKTGIKPIIYTYHKFYKDYLLNEFDDYIIWLAHYGPGKPHDQPWTFWQFSEKSTVSGINRPVDLNVFKGDSLAFEKIKVK